MQTPPTGVFAGSVHASQYCWGSIASAAVAVARSRRVVDEAGRDVLPIGIAYEENLHGNVGSSTARIEIL